MDVPSSIIFRNPDHQLIVVLLRLSMLLKELKLTRHFSVFIV